MTNTAQLESEHSHQDDSSLTSNHLIKPFVGDTDNNADEDALPELKKTPSVLQRIHSRLSIFHPKLKQERYRIIKKFASIYLIMLACILGIFSIYWGSFYKRNTRLKNLKMLVVIDDNDSFSGNQPLIGDTLRQVLNTTEAKALGNWQIQNINTFYEQADKHNNTIQEEIERQIHHQLYWSSIYVSKNASGKYYDYIMNDVKLNISTLIESIYETGRDFTNMNSYVIPSVGKIEQMWLQQQKAVSDLFKNSDNFTFQQVQKLNQPIVISMRDRIPANDPVLIAPSQVGLIYIIILTFFQVNMFGDVHQQVAKLNLKHHHYVLYRLAGSYLSYFILSLGYSLVTLAFQVDFTVTFGKSGFLVYWMISYLTMIAVGLMNEFMFMVLLIVLPPLVGFWLLFWVLINISATFSPMALVPKFYRFGYAMPIHNSYELTKVIFFDTYKGQMGRNIGIIIVWVVLTTIGLSLILKPFGRVMMQRAIKAKAAEVKAQQAKIDAEKKDEV